MDDLTVGQASLRTGWSPRMLRYLETAGLVAPRRTAAGYRLCGLREHLEGAEVARIGERDARGRDGEVDEDVHGAGG